MVLQYTVGWVGGRIGSGATVWHFDGPLAQGAGEAVADAIRQWYLTRAGTFPNEVGWTFPAEFRELSTVTGDLIGVEPINPPDPAFGTSTDVWSNGVGRMVRLRTAAIAGTRRLQGRIFLVPSSSVVFDNTGNVSSATITGDATAHQTLRNDFADAGVEHVIWSRTYGTTAPITSMVTEPRPTTLRTRND